MDMFVVDGGTPLAGCAEVGGSKNASLPMMAAAIMADGPVLLEGVPDLVDVGTLSKLLETLGVAVERVPVGDDADATPALRMEVRDERPVVADYELVRRMRAGFCVLGPLLARRGAACVSLPGGCNIGARPIDLHLKGLAALGADIRVERGYVVAKAQRLRGANVRFDSTFRFSRAPSIGASRENLMAKAPSTLRLETEAIVIGYAMSRLDRKYLQARGCASWKVAFQQAADALSVRPASLKNLRDEFDPFHPNGRKGWHKRALRKGRQRG